MHIVSLGEIIWDVVGEKEYLGGAPLNFSAASMKLGSTVALLSAVGMDQRGARALQLMEKLGLKTTFVQILENLPTGAAEVSSDSDGNTLFTIERPAAFDCLAIDDSLLVSLGQPEPDWLYFGTLAQTNGQLEKLLFDLLKRFPHARRFYDVNLREGHWAPALVERLSGVADILKLNRAEAEVLHSLMIGVDTFSLEEFCRKWASMHNIATICVTLGSEGCAIFSNDVLRTYPGFNVRVVDTVGAGDAFAAALLHGVHQGWPMYLSASLANALGAVVAGRSGATPEWSMKECLELIKSQKASRPIAG